jgi:prevent-host-death family protein
VTEIPARELRNHVSEVLRRVEAGERLTVTVSGRPVAELVPIERRRRFVPWEEFLTWPKADPGLRDELREMLPETTDDLPRPGDER